MVEATSVPSCHHLVVLCLLLSLTVELWLEATTPLLSLLGLLRLLLLVHLLHEIHLLLLVHLLSLILLLASCREGAWRSLDLWGTTEASHGLKRCVLGV